MRNYYRLVCLALLLGLRQPGLGQIAPAREDSLKGRIWTATAQRVAADEQVAAPKQWATGSAFTKWVLTQKPDKTELGSLFSAVLTRLGKGQPATPTQVAQAILTEVAQRKARKTGALAKVNLQALQVDLAPFVPAASTTSAILTAADSSDAATPAPPRRRASQVAADTNQASETLAAAPTPAYAAQPLAPRYFGLPPVAAGAVLALLGALLGAGIVASQAKKRHRHRRPHSSPTPPAELENSFSMTPPDYRKLQNQNRQLHKELQQLKQQLAALQKQLPTMPASLAASVAPEAPIASAVEVPVAPAAAEAPTEPTDDSLFTITMTVPTGITKPKAAPAPQLPAATRYGPVQETPFVEERKIVDAPLPQLALMLTLHPQTPDLATFTLNPSVDQARLIGDGLTRLQKFFDYDPPLGGRITLVTAATPGQLQRHADGWQVVQRARLTIS